MLTRTLLAAVSAIALSAGAYAQQGGGGGGAGGAGGGAAAPSASPSGNASPNAGGANSARDVAPGRTKDAGESARDEAPGRNKTGQSARDVAPGQTKDSGASGASEGSSGSGKDNNDKRSEQRSDDDKSGDKANRDDATKDRAAERDDVKRDRDAKDRADDADRQRDRNRDTADRERDRTGDRDRGATGASSGEAGKMKAKSLTNVTQEQRTRVKSVFVKHRDTAIVRDIDVSLNVGVVVPRSVRLHSVPSDIIAIVPEYRDYEYFIYENKVVIVDPATFEIVDIIIIA